MSLLITNEQARTIITQGYVSRGEPDKCIVGNIKIFDEMNLTNLFTRKKPCKLLNGETYLFNIDNEHILIIAKDNSLRKEYDYFQED